DAVAGVLSRILLLELTSDEIHLRLCSGGRHARLHASHHLQEIPDSALRALLNDERRPELRVLRWKREARRHDADDGESSSVEVERFAERVTAAEMPLPQAPADDDYVFLPGG